MWLQYGNRQSALKVGTASDCYSNKATVTRKRKVRVTEEGGRSWQKSHSLVPPVP
jgi:hypothetical protein